jgi:hypothetical protein
MASALLSRANTTLKGRDIGVNAVWDGAGDAGEDALDGVEAYRARLLFPDGKVFVYDSFDTSTLDSEAFARDVAYVPDGQTSTDPESASSRSTVNRAGQDGVEILVCTHGSRDCRCGDRGGALVRALRHEVEKRGLAGRVRVGDIAHVGGHK